MAVLWVVSTVLAHAVDSMVSRFLFQGYSKEKVGPVLMATVAALQVLRCPVVVVAADYRGDLIPTNTTTHVRTSWRRVEWSGYTDGTQTVGRTERGRYFD